MGASQSDLTPEELAELQEASKFSAKEIRSLYSRFQHIDRNRNGFITPTEFQLIPELSMNPLCERIIAILNRDGSERVDFRAFVQALGAFHPRASRSEKQQFAFRCYDIDGDGRISFADMFGVLKLLVGSNITDEELRGIVAQVFSSLGVAPEDTISFELFARHGCSEEAVAMLTLDFQLQEED